MTKRTVRVRLSSDLLRQLKTTFDNRNPDLKNMKLDHTHYVTSAILLELGQECIIDIKKKRVIIKNEQGREY